MNGQKFRNALQPAQAELPPPEISGTAYRLGDLADRAKAHLPDPYLPDPEHDWVLDPYGWTVYTLCGLVLRKAREARADDEMCRRCIGKALRLLREQRAT